MKSFNIPLPKGLEYDKINKSSLNKNTFTSNNDNSTDYANMTVWSSNNLQKAPEIYVPHICLINGGIVKYDWGIINDDYLYKMVPKNQNYAVRFIPILTYNNKAYCLFINEFGQIERFNYRNIQFFEKSTLLVDPVYIRKLICEKTYEPDLYIYNSYKELVKWNSSGKYYGEKEPEEVINI